MLRLNISRRWFIVPGSNCTKRLPLFYPDKAKLSLKLFHYIFYRTQYNQSMQRLSQLKHSLCPPSSSAAALLRTHLLAHKQKILQALEPQLSTITRQIVRDNYTRILRKVEVARWQLQRKGLSLRNTVNEQFFNDRDQIARFEEMLILQFQTILPSMLNEIAVGLAERVGAASNNNLLAKAIQLYNSVTGSYIHRFSCREMLTPTVRTLHSLQKQILNDVDETREGEGFLAVLYLLFAIFVHTFGKYITAPEKRVVRKIMQQAFVVSLIQIATTMEVGEIKEGQIQNLITEWIGELAILVK